MKKNYTLDYNIKRDVDRLAAIQEILNTLDRIPSHTELEQMASYILYGKDENGLNAVQRGETTDGDKRYKNFQRAAEKNKSLDEILENPLSNQTNLRPTTERYPYLKKKPSIALPKYDKEGNMIDPGDSDVPGMKELWARIDYIEHVIAVNEGKVPMDDTVSILHDSYRLYQLKHQLIDMRRHQYYLKDSFKPTIYFLNATPPQPQTIDWDSDSFYWISLSEWQNRTSHPLLSSISRNLDDYDTRKNSETGEIEVKWIVRRHNFDWENPKHIKALIDNYSNLYMQLHDKMFSWGRTLIYDFDRYFDMCKFSELRTYILTRKIDKASYPIIAEELRMKFGLSYNENHLSMIVTKEIPERMATMAKRHRLQLEIPDSRKKQCFTCKQLFPRHPLFFGRNNSRKDGFSSNCKECEKKKRIAKGDQTEHDRRVKDTPMFKVQATKTSE